MTLKGSEAIFAVADVVATVNFYRDVLGFTGHWLWGEPPTFAGLSWGKVSLMLCQQPDLVGKLEGHQHWFQCEDVAGMYQKHLAAGAPIIEPLEAKPWGLTEYKVRDPNGYHLRFAGPGNYVRPETAMMTLPPNIKIIERMPTVEEYTILAKAVGWSSNAESISVALKQSLFGVVAVEIDDGAQKAIGSIRVVGDGARFFYLQDVMVLPEYQNKRVGTAMMQVVMNWLRGNASKGAYIGLFTGKQAFYERFGFKPGGGMSLVL